MRINIEAILELIKDKYRNNKTFFAEVIGVERGYFNLVMNKKRTDRSPIICNAILVYCKNNNLDASKYLFLK